MRFLPATALCLLPVMPAQTYVVDAQNGPGTHFTTLTAAVAAVPDGAVLLVRPGAYAGFAMAGKGITILGDPGTSITSGIAVANTLPHQAVTLRELAWPTAQLAAGNVLLSLDTCSGPVLLENIVQPPHQTCLPSSPFGQCNRAIGISALRCAQLCVRDSTIRCTVRLESSESVIESCRFEGEGWFQAWTNQPGRTALTVWNGNAQISGASTMRGGDGYPFGLGAAAAGNGIALVSGSLRLLDGLVLAGANGVFPSFTIWTSGTTQLRISPRVVLAGALGPGSGTDVMPEIAGASAPPGGSLAAAVTTEAGDLVILVVGLPGPPIAVPGIQDAFWLDPAVHVFHTIAVQQSGQRVTGSVAVPNVPGFLGQRLNWQAACLGPATGFQATNPTITLVR